jgi:hypothetical protein
VVDAGKSHGEREQACGVGTGMPCGSAAGGGDRLSASARGEASTFMPL